MSEAGKILLKALYTHFSIPFFTKGFYNLNIFGVRAKNRDTNLFDDLICIAFKSEAGWETMAFPATTDPGMSVLEDKMGNPNGTAYLPVSTLKNAQRYKFRIGKHKNKYVALVQAIPFTILRDNDKNGKAIPLEREKELLLKGLVSKGYFGINIHRSTSHGSSREVNDWSWGCQVIQSSFDWEKFIGIVLHSSAFYGNTFTYTLFSEDDIKEVLGLSLQSFSYIMNGK